MYSCAVIVFIQSCLNIAVTLNPAWPWTQCGVKNKTSQKINNGLFLHSQPWNKYLFYELLLCHLWSAFYQVPIYGKKYKNRKHISFDINIDDKQKKNKK